MRDTTLSEPLSVDCARSKSQYWTLERLLWLTERPLRNPALARIEDRRRALAELPPFTLHASYAGKNAHAGQPFVTPGTISLPRRYGRILYSIAAETRPRFALEAGAGLGISGMYLGAGTALTPGARFLSFEIGDYADIAGESIRMTMPAAEVRRDGFENFARHLDPTAAVDLCFLDAKHDRDSVLRDYRSLLGWISPRGVVMIDDVTSTPGSRAAWEHILGREDFGFAALIRDRIGFLAP